MLRGNKYYNDYCATFERENGKIHIVQEVEGIIGKELHEKYMLGICHAIWPKTKKLYVERGYSWYSPQELHSTWCFD